MDYTEKRRHPRLILISPVRISPLISPSEKQSPPIPHKDYQGLIRNISLSGLGIESYEIMAVGKKYLFSFSTGNLWKIKVNGEIKWSSEMGGRRLYGIEFTKDNPWLTRLKIYLVVRRLSCRKI